jgi:hypothetical protein
MECVQVVDLETIGNTEFQNPSHLQIETLGVDIVKLCGDPAREAANLIP